MDYAHDARAILADIANKVLNFLISKLHFATIHLDMVRFQVRDAETSELVVKLSVAEHELVGGCFGKIDGDQSTLEQQSEKARLFA